MSRSLTRHLPALAYAALAALLLAQLAACSSGSAGHAPDPNLSRVQAQAHAQPITTATPTAPGPLSSALASAAESAMATNGPLTFNTAYVNAVIAITNQFRAANGCAPLTANPILMSTAQDHSNDMALNHYFAHTSATGLTPAQRMVAAGYHFSIQAENIAAGYDTPQSVMDTWFYETPPNDAHRRNILDCRLREIGVGYCFLANDSNHIAYHSYWTEDFGTPA